MRRNILPQARLKCVRENPVAAPRLGKNSHFTRGLRPGLTALPPLRGWFVPELCGLVPPPNHRPSFHADSEVVPFQNPGLIGASLTITSSVDLEVHATAELELGATCPGPQSVNVAPSSRAFLESDQYCTDGTNAHFLDSSQESLDIPVGAPIQKGKGAFRGIFFYDSNSRTVQM